MAHSLRLSTRIRERIAAAGGGIPFDEYMAAALYEPGLGYYAAGSVKFGSDGDFVTAPELSDTFARCVAVQCADVIEAVGGGIVEFGAGSGALARDLLRCLAEIDRLPEFYAIVEPSPDLRERQRRLLDNEAPRLRELIDWWPELPRNPIRGVVLGNEVVDAFPVKRFALRSDVIEEVYVGAHGEDLIEFADIPSANLAAAVSALVTDLGHELPTPYQSEINLLLAPWLNTVSTLLAQGMILLVDYGYSRHEYYHPQRRQGTLICHYRHHAHDDTLLWPGLQDISAFVDFTALAEAADAARLQLAGYATQAGFVLSTAALLHDRTDLSARDRLRLANSLKSLTLPGIMGEKFKVMAFSQGCDVALRCMPQLDQRHRLLSPRS